MIASDISFLVCLDCGGGLSLGEAVFDGEVIIEGILRCKVCGREYPILETVGIFFRREVILDFLAPFEVAAIRARGWDGCLDGAVGSGSEHSRLLAVTANWEYQWGELADSWTSENLEGGGYLGPAAFWEFVPIDPARVTGKRVLIAAGGLGREAYHLAKAKPARLFFNEIGTEIYKVRKLVADADLLMVLLRCDILNMPLANGVADVAICDHALQHVEQWQKAYDALLAVTVPGGQIAICVYSHENNFIMTKIIDPAKWLFHKFPLRGQRAVAFPLALVIYLNIWLLYVPLTIMFPVLKRWLPLYKHFMMWKAEPFSLVWMQCFDLVHAPVSYHFRRAEMEELARSNDLRIVTLTNTNSTLWSLIAERPAAP
jgi:SAM-dependent methyltransferase/uncharacterized protein YbaR (Trm112 family)